MGKRLASASRRYKDVPVVLNGELVHEREGLMNAIATAEVGPQRLTTPVVAQARKDLEEWEREHAGEILTVRVYSCIGSEWKTAQLKNPLPTEKSQRDQEMVRFGFDIGGTVADVVEQTAAVVDGDDEEKPTADEWAGFWANIGEGDRRAIVNAALSLNGTTSEQALGDLGKA